MALEAFKGFRSLETQHCITGSMKHIYDFYGHDISEDMLLGIGDGVGLIYWHQKGAPPMIGGRANFARPGIEGQEIVTGRRTGVQVERHYTSSARKAEKTLLELLEAGQPVMLYVDMGFLPYFDFGGEEYHFGGHAVVVGGYDAARGQVLIADRDAELYTLSLEQLDQARGSTYKPFPPHHQWLTFDFSEIRQPTPDEVLEAIRGGVRNMLEGPISNIGLPGISKAAKLVPKWPEKMGEKQLRNACFNGFVFIDATGGTGGGLFRYMYSRFLSEAAEIIGEARLKASSDEFRSIGDRWQDAAELFKQAYAAPKPEDVLPDIAAQLLNIADCEEAAWHQLREIVKYIDRLV